MAATVILRNPRREVAVPSNRRVKEILHELGIIPETVLVIAGDTLITLDHIVREDETIELRPVMSGGGPGEM
ncbi:MAG: thiamine biosynthesis protein ThiS [Candidatus Rokuibacteriota bacterium]